VDLLALGLRLIPKHRKVARFGFFHTIELLMSSSYDLYVCPGGQGVKSNRIAETESQSSLCQCSMVVKEK